MTQNDSLNVRRSVSCVHAAPCSVTLHAHDAGFDLHAGVTVAAGNRPRLERLCRYVCHPPLGQHRLRRLVDGGVAVALQRAWADGTPHLVFTPGELLERLATLVPRPRINLRSPLTGPPGPI